jgi:hypothetical protein
VKTGAACCLADRRPEAVPRAPSELCAFGGHSHRYPRPAFEEAPHRRLGLAGANRTRSNLGAAWPPYIRNPRCGARSPGIECAGTIDMLTFSPAQRSAARNSVLARWSTVRTESLLRTGAPVERFPSSGFISKAASGAANGGRFMQKADFPFLEGPETRGSGPPIVGSVQHSQLPSNALNHGRICSFCAWNDCSKGAKLINALYPATRCIAIL